MVGIDLVSAIEIPGYKILRTLGVGGQATVYLAIQKGFDREVALKIMSPVLAADPTFGERFIREAKIVAKLSHKSIVTVYDAGESGNFYYLAMEYMPGGDLKDRIEKGMKARECLNIISKLAIALHFAHEKGYIHRDVKSENIIFNEDGEPVLTDFGIAKASNSSTQMTQTGKLIGTPEYMSPEQCRGKKVDGRTDLYSLGIILFEMLTRKVPFTGDDSVSVCIQQVTKPIPKLPARLKHFQWLVELLLSKDVEQRFQSGKDLAKAVNAFKKTGQKTTDIGAYSENHQTTRKATEQSKTVVADIINEVDEGENEFFDDLHTEKRVTHHLQNTKKGISGVVTFILLVIVAAGGYWTKDKWFEQAQSWVKSNVLAKKVEPVELSAKATDNESNNLKPEINEQLSEKANNLKNEVILDNSIEQVSESDKILSKSAVPIKDINTLIAEAEGLIQNKPQTLNDIKQALQVIIVAKSLELENIKVKRLYKKAMDIALFQAVYFAKSNDMKQSDSWANLVETEQVDYDGLEEALSEIDKIKKDFELKKSVQIEQQRKIKIKEDLLLKADLAFKQNRLSTPVNDSAVYYYNEVLKLEKDNQLALAGIKNVKQSYVNKITFAIDNKSYSKARKLHQSYSLLLPAPSILSQLSSKISQGEKEVADKEKEAKRLAQLAKRKKQADVEYQNRMEDPMAKMQLLSILNRAVELEALQQYVEPEGDNALQKYRSALLVDERNQQAKQGIIEIEKNIIQNLTSAISALDKNLALIWLNKLKRIELDQIKIASYQSSIDEIILPAVIMEKTPVVEADNNFDDDLKGSNSKESKVESSEIKDKTEVIEEDKNK